MVQIKDGQFVKIKFNNLWRSGRYKTIGGRPYLSNLTYDIPINQDDEVVPYICVEDEDAFIKENFEKNREGVLKELKNILDSIFKGVEVEVGEENFTILDVLNISPTIIDVRSISSFEQRFGWSVNLVVYSHGSTWEQSTSDLVTVGEFEHVNLLLKCVAESVFKIKSENYWDRRIADASEVVDFF